MKHGPSHLFPDHVIVNFTLQEYAALGRILEADPTWFADQRRVIESRLDTHERRINKQSGGIGRIDDTMRLLLESIRRLQDKVVRLESGITIDRREGQRRTFEWMRRRKPERRRHP